MTEFLATNPLAISAAESPWFPFLNSHPNPSTRTQLNPNPHAPFCPKLSKTSGNKCVSAALSSRSNGSSSGMPGRHSFYDELEFEDRKAKNFELERNPFDDEGSPSETGSIPIVGVEEDNDCDDNKGSRKSNNDLGEDELIRVQGDGDGDRDDGVDLRKDDQVEKFGGNKLRLRRGKQVIRRSNLLAKQVISIDSALSLGFVSQLWVDTTSVSHKNNSRLFWNFFILLMFVLLIWYLFAGEIFVYLINN